MYKLCVFLFFLIEVSTFSSVLGDQESVNARRVIIPKVFPECPASFIREAIVGHDGTIWVAGERSGVYRLTMGLTSYDTSWYDMRYYPGLPDTEAFTCIVEDKQHRIWVGTDNKGIAVFNGKEWQVYNKENTLSGEHVYSIAVAPGSGVVAVATSGGISLYNPEKNEWWDLTRADGLVEDQVESLAFDDKDNLWLAYSCAGVSVASPSKAYKDFRQIQSKWYWDTNQYLRQPEKNKGEGLSSNLCNKILPVEMGKILVGTCAGLACLDEKKRWKYVRGMDYDAKNKGAYDQRKNKFRENSNKENLLPQDYITCLAESEKGYWVGTRDEGVALLDKFHLNVLKKISGDKNSPLPCKWIRSILILANGTVLGASYGKGIFVLVSKSGEGLISKSNDLISNNMPAFPVFPDEKKWKQTCQSFIDGGKTSSNQLTPSSAAVFAEEDWSTLGDWCGHYGNRSTVLCAANAPSNDGVIDDTTFYRLRKSPPNKQGIEYIQYALYGVSCTLGPLRTPDDSIRSWIMTINEPYNRSILYFPDYHLRTKSDWDDHGEAYPMSLDGPDLWLIVDVPEGVSTLSLYFYNKDGFSLPSDARRDYLVEIKKYKPKTDPSLLRMSFELAQKFKQDEEVEKGGNYIKDLENMLKAPVLARCRVKDFISNGVYKTFSVKGPATYSVRICRNNSFNTIVSGVFLGQDICFREPESKEHINPVFLDENFGPPAIPVLVEGSLEWNLCKVMTMNVYDGSLIGSVISQRKSFLLNTYRFLNVKKNFDDALMTHVRRALHLWTQNDRENFDQQTEELWEKTQMKVPACRSHTFCPHSIGTIPFSVAEVVSMDNLGIEWKQYRINSPIRPQLSVDDMKKKLQKYLDQENKKQDNKTK